MTVYPIPGFFEPVNAILHLGAAGVFTVLGAGLIRRCLGDHARTALFGIFACSAVLLLSISGVFHLLNDDGAGAAVLLRLDKACIFVLIAGTFTPVQGVLVRGTARWMGLVLMWAAAATGVTLTTVFFEQVPFGLSIALYIALGWLAGLSVFGAWRQRGFAYVRPVVVGGVAYSAGAILLGLKWPTIIPGVFGPHETWHIAVIIGLGLHWRFISRLERTTRRRVAAVQASGPYELPAAQSQMSS